ncbi:MAG: sporulation protein YunB [Clostridiales bacterium]|nr:sporulation protein YunB [Clostridiales bacterium]
MWVYKRRRRRIRLLIFLFFCIVIVVLLFIRFRLIFITLCKNEIQSVSQQIVNNVVTGKLDVLDKELLQFEKDENGEITFVNSNVIYMNKLANEISIDISKEINELDYLYVDVPIGSLFGSDMLNSVGPDIKIRFIPVGDVETDFKTEFSSTGINQTKHKVFLEIVCEIQALSIVADTLVSTTLRIPIVETVIVVGVPSTYYHLESWRNDDILNVLE